MCRLSIIRRFNLAAHRFAAAREGNIALTFAIAVLPLLGFVGAAIDYSRAANARSAMQAALDSTSLMLSKDLSTGTITQSQISTKAVSYFTALYTNKDAQGVSITATYTPGSGTTGNTVAVNGTGSITTDFMRIAGFPTMGYGANSTSTWGTSLLRVALVLDTTGSMADYNKIGNLQTAAKNLVTQLSNLVVNTGDVYISVIPVRDRRQCRHVERRRELVALGPLGSQQLFELESALQHLLRPGLLEHQGAVSRPRL